jgi:hypothetical protein
MMRVNMIETASALIRCAFLHPAFFLLVLLALVTSESGLADDADVRLPRLWIVYGEGQSLSDGTVVLPLEIHFDNVQRANRLESLSDITAGVASLPALGPSVKQSKPLVYRAIPVTKTGKKWTIQLSTGAPRNFAVRVQARHVANGGTTYLAAETNCAIFGRKLGARAESKAEALTPAWFSGLGMSIEPPFYYWPQTEDPLQVTLHLSGRALPKTTLNILDGSSLPTQYVTDHAGKVVYAPPDDPALNKQGEKAVKQVFLVSVYREGNDLFVAIRTLRLHRNRFSHRQLDMGLTLFGATTLLTGGAVVWARRRRRPA